MGTSAHAVTPTTYPNTHPSTRHHHGKLRFSSPRSILLHLPTASLMACRQLPRGVLICLPRCVDLPVCHCLQMYLPTANLAHHARQQQQAACPSLAPVRGCAGQQRLLCPFLVIFRGHAGPRCVAPVPCSNLRPLWKTTATGVLIPCSLLWPCHTTMISRALAPWSPPWP